jgi:hypothetical protein
VNTRYNAMPTHRNTLCDGRSSLNRRRAMKVRCDHKTKRFHTEHCTVNFVIVIATSKAANSRWTCEACVAEAGHGQRRARWRDEGEEWIEKISKMRLVPSLFRDIARN